MIEVNIIDLLRSDTVQFTFIKADGSERIAVGTRNMNLIPEDKRPTGMTENKANDIEEGKDRVVTYYDLDANGWRSFKLNSVKKVHSYGNIR
jgi:hypothetical protein